MILGKQYVRIASYRPDPQRAKLWWSALAVERLELWSMRFHTICHNYRKTNHLCLTAPFSQDAEYNTNSQSRQTGENRSGIALATNLSLSTSLFLALSLCSLGLLHSFISVCMVPCRLSSTSPAPWRFLICLSNLTPQ